MFFENFERKSVSLDRVIAIIQARMNSTRLPGKSLMDIAGKPLVQHVIERLSRSKRIDEVVLAVTEDVDDAPLVALADTLGVGIVSGSRDDVLARYVLAARVAHADVVVRVTGDCPLIDPALSDDVIEAYYRESAEYASNWLVRSFPRGADTEAFSVASLKLVDQKTAEPNEREHVTPYYYRHPEEFRTASVEADDELRRPDLRLCVDTEEDLRLVREIYARLGNKTNDFSIRDVVRLIDQEPALADINANVQQKQVG